MSKAEGIVWAALTTCESLKLQLAHMHIKVLLLLKLTYA